MIFQPPLAKAVLLRRYKRFLADVELPNGQLLTVHCPNTGSMKNCLVPGSLCYLSDANNPKRKYRFTLELVTSACGHLAGVNTGRANGLVEEVVRDERLSSLRGYTSIRREQKYGDEGSRIDLLLSRDSEQCFVEVKSVTLAVEGRRGLFPDAVSTRGAKHLRELMAMSQRGHRAVLFFCVQHAGIDTVSPADEIDPEYGGLLREAAASGVEILAMRAELSADAIRLCEPLPVIL